MARTRLAHVEDPDAHALLAEYFAARAAGFPGGEYRTSFPDPSDFEPGRGVFLVLDHEGAAAGCGGIRRIAPGRYEIKHLFVRPGGRGHGWGRRLLDDLEQHAWDAGATELVLDTHHSLEAAASLYARAGFESIEPYNDNPNATRWYGKALV